MTKEQRNAFRELLTNWDNEVKIANEGTMMSMSEATWVGITYNFCTKQLRELLIENFHDWSE